MDWLRTMSRKGGVSGRTMYEEYADSATGDWYASVQHYETHIISGWTFCRGGTTMSSSDIAGARNRYLDKYPLTAEGKSSASYVDTLMMLDEKQIALRCEDSGHSMCALCREKDLEIKRLRLSLAGTRELDVQEQTRLDYLMISEVFRRYYTLDRSETIPRATVRLHLERVMQEQVGPDEVILSTGAAWRMFLRKKMGVSVTATTPLRCRRLLDPICATDE